MSVELSKNQKNEINNVNEVLQLNYEFEFK